MTKADVTRMMEATAMVAIQVYGGTIQTGQFSS
jgi:hypothetical protein